jgi:hypothetical protein
MPYFHYITVFYLFRQCVVNYPVATRPCHCTHISVRDTGKTCLSTAEILILFEAITAKRRLFLPAKMTVFWDLFLRLQYVSICHILTWTRSNVIGILTWLRDGRWRVRIFVRAKICVFSKTSWRAVGPKQHYVQKGPEFFPGVRQPGSGFDHLSPFSAEVKNEWSYTSTSPHIYIFIYTFMARTGPGV